MLLFYSDIEIHMYLVTSSLPRKLTMWLDSKFWIILKYWKCLRRIFCFDIWFCLPCVVVLKFLNQREKRANSILYQFDFQISTFYIHTYAIIVNTNQCTDKGVLITSIQGSPWIVTFICRFLYEYVHWATVNLIFAKQLISWFISTKWNSFLLIFI